MDGKREGEYTITRPDGFVERGQFVDGKKQGEFTLTMPDGSERMLDQFCDAGKFTLFVIESPETPGFEQAVAAMVDGVPEEVRDIVEIIAITDSEHDLQGGVTVAHN